MQIPAFDTFCWLSSTQYNYGLIVINLKEASKMHKYQAFGHYGI